MIGLTKRQFECLDVIVRYQEKHQITPSMDEIAQIMGLRSKSGASQYVEILIKRGYLRRLKRAPRALKVLHKANNSDLISAARTLALAAKETHPLESAVVLQELRWLGELKKRKRPLDKWEDPDDRED